MSWLRVDDQMILHPKIGRLTDQEFRALIALWSYCANRKNGGIFTQDELKNVPRATQEGLKSVSRAHLRKFQEAGLVRRKGRTGDSWQINDWADFQPKDPTAAERMKRYRDRNADRNEDRNGDRNESVTRARAARPVPSLETTPPTPPQAGGRSLTRKELRRYTGCRYVYNGRAPTYVRDPLGTDKKPEYWTHPPPTREEILAALAERETAHA